MATKPPAWVRSACSRRWWSGRSARLRRRVRDRRAGSPPRPRPRKPASHTGAASRRASRRRARQAHLLRRRQQRDAARVKGLTDAYTALHPNVTFEIETRPGGTDGDNIVKTRLATGDMADIFWYNSGSLLQALNPTDTLVDLSASRSSRTSRTRTCRRCRQATRIFGVPSEPRDGRRHPLQQEDLRASSACRCPRRWAEFAANNEKIKAGRHRRRSARPTATPGPRSCSCWPTTTTSQQAVPDFAEKYTANKAHYADTPAAQAGFQHLQEGFDKGWYQKDFGAAKFDDGLNALADGKIAHYPMLTFALGTIADNHPGHDPRHRLLRPAGRRRREQRRHDLDAGRDLHRQDHQEQLDAAKDFLGVHRARSRARRP